MKLLKLFKKTKTTDIELDSKAELPNEKPKSRAFEKVLMGAIIGGAIGSVVGASIKRKNPSESSQKKFSFLKKILGIKKKIPIETDKTDL